MCAIDSLKVGSATTSGLVRAGFASAALRGLSLGGKLLFLVYIGKHLAIEDMAVYGLLVATVTLAATLLGCEFNAFSQREFLARTGADRTVCIRDQLAFHVVAYLLLIPLAAPVFAAGILPWRVAPYFILQLKQLFASQQRGHDDAERASQTKAAVRTSIRKRLEAIARTAAVHEAEVVGFEKTFVTIQGSVQTDSIGVPCGACRGRRAGAARTHRSG